MRNTRPTPVAFDAVNPPPASSSAAALPPWTWGPRSGPLPYRALHHAFLARAEEQPGTVAIEHGDQNVTYGDLRRQSQIVAAELHRLGVQPGDHVGLFLERSIPMVAGMLGVLSCGASYVPQHVGVVPPRQLRHVATKCRMRVILTLSHLRDQIELRAGMTVIELDTLLARPRAVASPVPAVDVPAGATAFVLFTSGTTGFPNGVVVTHRNVCNIVHTEPGRLGVGPGTRVAQLLSIAFDMAAWEIWTCLSWGGRLVMREGGGSSHASIARAASRAQVLVATPSVLEGIDAATCPEVHTVAVAGEPCPVRLARTWSSRATFFNSCGPTETTIVNTMQRYDGDARGLTIGAPTPNNAVYVLDGQLRPCEVGQVGQMWAGGDGVTAGYLGNDVLTRERYRPDPFRGQGQMFATGDLGCWTAHGELEHHGRTDDQVKIRGFRVELDSISRVLEGVPGCQHAVTLKRDTRTLVAFVTPNDLDVRAARAAVARALPYYCVPERIIGLDRLPATERGKVDKRTLLALAAAGEVAS